MRYITEKNAVAVPLPVRQISERRRAFLFSGKWLAANG